MIGKLLCIILIIVLVVLIWRNTDYFSDLSETDEWRGLIAWDVLMLICMLIGVVIKLIK